jgi:oligoribonuclease
VAVTWAVVCKGQYSDKRLHQYAAFDAAMHKADSVHFRSLFNSPGPMTATSSDKNSNLIWIDLEMTGLDSRNDSIIEIATIVTDRFLNELAEGPVIAIRHDEETMASMDAWNTTQHGKSGLTARVLDSETGMQAAEAQTLEFLRAWVDPGASPMCGNSICQDRRFMARLMPDLEAFFHYRNLDVSTLKILAKLWAPAVAEGFAKESAHLALADIRDSIAELRWYREALLDQTALTSGAD